ncbi:MAG: CPBP family intramembrane glutamic endopeptidase [Myxococcota bacterium]
MVQALRIGSADRLLEPAARPVEARARARVVLVTTAVLLAVMHYAIFLGEPLDAMTRAVVDLVPSLADTSLRPIIQKVVWALGTVVFYLVLPAIVVRVVLRERLRDHGLDFAGFFRHLPIYLALFVPVGLLVLAVASQPDFLETYPLYRSPRGVADLVVWELVYGAQFLALEFFFRGFLLHGTRPAIGNHAIWVMIVPYVMIHFSKPLYETIGAAVAGFVLGHLSLRTRSVAGGALLHWGVAMAMDLAALAQRPTFWSG